MVYTFFYFFPFAPIDFKMEKNIDIHFLPIFYPILASDTGWLEKGGYNFLFKTQFVLAFSRDHYVPPEFLNLEFGCGVTTSHPWKTLLLRKCGMWRL